MSKPRHNPKPESPPEPKPDYERLYHLLNRRRGLELTRLAAAEQALAALKADFHETDRMAEHAAETQGEPALQILPGGGSPTDPDSRIDSFLFRLDSRLHLKRAAAARAAMRILLEQGDKPLVMTTLYRQIVEQIGGTTAGAERNLRSFRQGAEEMDTEYYRAHLAGYNSNNAEFYWNARRVLRAELDRAE